LLAICGDYVLAFSDKSSNFQFENDEQVAWGRWYRTAVDKSVRQLIGASRNLFQLQVPIFKDKACKVPLGIPIPSANDEKVHSVAVVSLTRTIDEKAPPRPFITIDGSVVGDQHVQAGAVPFKFGDVSPNTGFVHVMDVAGLWAVLTELDTITDFARYLDARKAFIRGKAGNSASSEHSLLARYLLSFTAEGDQLPLDSASPGNAHLDDSEWQSESVQNSFRARRKANEISYVWDAIIDRQARLLETQGFDFSTFDTVLHAERALRHMALESRLSRRILGSRWMTACMIKAPGQGANIRTVPHVETNSPTYVFFTAKQPSHLPRDRYRHRRREMLSEFMLVSLIDFPTSKLLVGIASELGQRPDSYDLMSLNIEEDANQESLWADAMRCWEMKKSVFGEPRYSVGDEWDIPSID
jgi:hypothetical protein